MLYKHMHELVNLPNRNLYDVLERVYCSNRDVEPTTFASPRMKDHINPLPEIYKNDTLTTLPNKLAYD
jgi:hypothetical protein